MSAVCKFQLKITGQPICSLISFLCLSAWPTHSSDIDFTFFPIVMACSFAACLPGNQLAKHNKGYRRRNQGGTEAQTACNLP